MTDLGRAIAAAAEALSVAFECAPLTGTEDWDFLARIAVEAAAPYLFNEEAIAARLAAEKRAERAEAEVERLRAELVHSTGNADYWWRRAEQAESALEGARRD